MPANYLEIVQSLPEHARATADLLAGREDACAADRAMLLDPYLDLQGLGGKIDEALQKLSALYAARPYREPFSARIPLPELPAQYTFLGIDGSQIVPSRFQAIPFGMINVGWIGIEHGSGLTPWVGKRSKIIPFKELFGPMGSLISDTEVDLRRDFAERELIPLLLADENAPLRIALSDGPLEVHRSREDLHADPRMVARISELEALLASRRLVHAGYIDKPGSAMLSRMLAIGRLEKVTPDAVTRAMQALPANDLELLQGHLEQPGQRSAVFEIISKRPQARGEADAKGQRVFCFYLCVGKDELNAEAILARVEFAEWVAADASLTAALHAAVFADTQATPAHPFPYVLTRAHEEAVIGRNEYSAIEKMLRQAWHEAGLEYGSMSGKAFGKERLGG